MRRVFDPEDFERFSHVLARLENIVLECPDAFLNEARALVDLTRGLQIAVSANTEVMKEWRERVEALYEAVAHHPTSGVWIVEESACDLGRRWAIHDRTQGIIRLQDRQWKIAELCLEEEARLNPDKVASDGEKSAYLDSWIKGYKETIADGAKESA